MTAKEYLEQIRRLDSMIRNKRNEVDQLRSAASGVVRGASGGDRVKSSGSQRKMADCVDRTVDLEKEILRLEAKRRGIIQVIERLPIAEYDVLHRLYVLGMSINEAARDLKKSYSWVTTNHSRGLRHVSEVIDNPVKQ